ncbi:MAG: uracil-DNA glycosylase [Rhizobiales bacterium]|nr:uracil-DNA glycosylase [Hyphomicrobiales bacterium]
MTPDRELQAVTAFIDWYREAGVTLDFGETATDWFAKSAALAPGGAGDPIISGGIAAPTAHRAPAPASRQSVAQPGANARVATPPAPTGATTSRRPLPDAPAARPGPAAPKAPTTLDEATRARILAAPSLAALHAILANYDGCPLKRTARSLCYFRGVERARLMVIGEAPGGEEDQRGKPFVGPAGQLLDRMLAAIGLDEGDVHITNIVYWRPPGNRNPTAEEVEACRPFLERQMALVDPEFVLLLGRPAANHLLANEESIKRLRGRWMALPFAAGAGRRVLATFHPAYLLRTPGAKRDTWSDLLRLKLALEGAPESARTH